VFLRHFEKWERQPDHFGKIIVFSIPSLCELAERLIAMRPHVWIKYLYDAQKYLCDVMGLLEWSQSTI